MDVRIFGPNLSGAAQKKGDMHVHAEGCGDCKFYGYGKKYGGDDFDGWQIEASTIEDAVEAIYGPSEFNYDPETEIDTYTDSMYFAPCVTLPNRPGHGERRA